MEASTKKASEAMAAAAAASVESSAARTWPESTTETCFPARQEPAQRAGSRLETMWIRKASEVWFQAREKGDDHRIAAKVQHPMANSGIGAQDSYRRSSME